VFGLAPALGLPPEPPGVEAAPLAERQLWWLGTAAATALGLGLIAFAPRRLLKAVGAIALILPHAVGAPGPEAHGGPVPQDLVQAFWVASLATTALFWLVLGGLAGFLYPRLA
jgi:cobalt transporter subunit CbtA